jgi:hypothetical protein
LGIAVFEEANNDVVLVCFPTSQPQVQIPFIDLYDAVRRIDVRYRARQAENFRLFWLAIEYIRIGPDEERPPLRWD